MVDQRRVVPPGYSEEQIQRTLRSGEHPPSEEQMPWYSRMARNLAISVPRAGAGLSQGAAALGAGIRAGLSDESTFSDELIGKGVQDQLNKFVEDNAMTMFQRLPREQQTQNNLDRIASSIQGSKSYEDKWFELSHTAYTEQSKAANQLNEIAGLGRPGEETIVDEAQQALGTAFLPTGKIKLIGKGANLAARVGGRVLENLVPGSTGSLTSIATNAAADVGLGQAMRWYADAPSVFTGDYKLSEEMAAKRQQYENELKAANTQSVVNTASAGQPATAARVARVGGVANPTVTNLPPQEEDEDGGFVGKNWLYGVAGAGALATALIALRGKSPHAVIDLHSNERLTMPGVARNTVTPQDMLTDDPAHMSKWDKWVTQTTDDTRPLDATTNQAIKNLRADQQARAQEHLANLKYRASHQEIQSEVQKWMTTGQMPGVSRQLPTFEDIEAATSHLSPDQQKLYFEGMQLKHQHDVLQRNIKNLDDKVNDLQIKAARGKVSWAQYYTERGRLNKMRDPAFEIQQGLSVRDARTKMAQFDADPNIKAIERMYRQTTQGVLEGVNSQGLMDPASIQRLMRTGPNFVHQLEDKLGGGGFWERLGKYMKLGTEGRTKEKMYHSVRPVSRSTGNMTGEEVGGIKNPINANESLRAYVSDYIEFVNQNNAIKYAMDMMSHSPDWGRVARRAHNPISVFDFNKQSKVRGTAIESLLADKRTVGYTANGQVHLFQVHDPGIAQGLQFNPASALPVFDWARRATQKGFTTYNPAFAIGKAASYDYFTMWMNRKPGQAFGYLDMWNRKMFPNGNVLTEILKHYPDPTMHAHALWVGSLGASRQLLSIAAKRVADDLKFDSGFWHQMAQIPGMEHILEKISEAGIRQYKESWYALADAYGIKGHVYHPLSIDASISRYDDMLSKSGISGAARVTAEGYKAVLDNYRNMMKTAQFFQDVSVQMSKHPNGIPKKMFRQIVHDNKVMGGNMTLKPGNKGIAAGESFFAYSNVTANSVAMLGQSLMRDPIGFGTRFFTGIAAPSLFMNWLLAQDKDTYEWYFNTLSTFERVATMPTIKPEYWLKVAQGGDTTLKPADIYLEPMAQEMALATSIINTMARAAGFMEGSWSIGPGAGYQPGDPRIKMSDARRQMPFLEIGQAVSNMLPLQAPGLVEILTGGKVNFANPIKGQPILQNEPEDKSLGLSNPSNTVAGSIQDAILSFMGGVGNIMEMASAPMTNAVLNDGNYLDALKDTFGWTGFAVENKMSDYIGTGATIWTNGQRRRYATTPPRERVTAARKVADQLMAQRSAEKGNKKFPDYRLPTIDPKTVAMSNDIIAPMTSGMMRTLDKKRGEINRQIKNLDYNKGRYKPDEYHRMNIHLFEQLHEIDERQDRIVTDMENGLRRKYDMSAKEAFAYIKSNLLPAH